MTIYDETLRARAADPFEEGAGCESTARRPGISREAVGKRRQAYRATGRDGPPGMGHGTCGWEAKVARLNSLTRLLRSRSDSSPSSKSATHLIWAALEFSRNQSTVSFEKYMDLALERNCPASALDLTAMVTPPSRWPCRTRAGPPGRRRRPRRGPRRRPPSRPTPRKADDPGPRRAVREELDAHWSPEQISGRLRRGLPDNGTMDACREAIYQAVCAQSRDRPGHGAGQVRDAIAKKTTRLPESMLDWLPSRSSCLQLERVIAISGRFPAGQLGSCGGRDGGTSIVREQRCHECKSASRSCKSTTSNYGNRPVGMFGRFSARL